MTKLNTQPYKGARDIYPEEMRLQNYIFDTWKRVCNRYCFEQYSFPVLENFEVFSAKSGQEIVNEQLFSFEDKGGRKVALRPELTPSTVRMIAEKFNILPQPIKWFMIGDNWRYEKPQKGRGREFYQLEVNIFGIDEVTADFEILSVATDILKEFGANETMFEIRFSDRRLVNLLLNDVLKLDFETATEVRRIMDKRAKMSESDFVSILTEMGLSPEYGEAVEKFLGSSLETLPDVIDLDVLKTNKGYENIMNLSLLLGKSGLLKYCRFDPSIIRGFEYSDGLVYEIYDKNVENSRSLFGGERFDGLITIFGNYKLGATGFAMGDITLAEFLKGWKLIPNFDDALDYFVTLWPGTDSRYLEKSLEVASKLRQDGKKVFTWLQSDTKIDKQLKYADKKNAKFAIIIGDAEIKSNKMIIKDMRSGQQKELEM
ncbi:histidine--tRNA ligase [candidate division WWE3 bacterium RIFOXYC1_FULL_40_10]|uniref:Histidine--tRNA ligase n=1 Tax=candidate division WWE3 bacterium RIFOXYA2_FULL_46_9 TaxID=1802636 RepID=A0A1F4W1T4_UNCKA|nr:MAG: histidine--tRNA ligase [candidate division WWE3 bacterium RIFOXYB1_FULL_40_22]OGC61439.1 MAG: histidine--tRNA ligase [candidate division WWE3 bacterium RIFOXYA1_FULL_40_11]OGC63372.1 MAG: histidine--tRNA ligase [candidate division WWE3 bacterium RIFOXYA2_FULL_46_9]OGC64440.1 MAG: histidine--tRNA ligase [candidate division WWE3 bacterium RIFOXYB2_FULL_41_6]OGC65822.1 MAG: histidine--tRNA ligase [candidate division WWE3 bacterium RIFOXYC1_FULL_40_10]OGC67359.1 MAG: histidine--tRNA ligase